MRNIAARTEPIAVPRLHLCRALTTHPAKSTAQSTTLPVATKIHEHDAQFALLALHLASSDHLVGDRSPDAATQVIVHRMHVPRACRYREREG